MLSIENKDYNLQKIMVYLKSNQITKEQSEENRQQFLLKQTVATENNTEKPFTVSRACQSLFCTQSTRSSVASLSVFQNHSNFSGAIFRLVVSSWQPLLNKFKNKVFFFSNLHFQMQSFEVNLQSAGFSLKKLIYLQQVTLRRRC